MQWLLEHLPLEMYSICTLLVQCESKCIVVLEVTFRIQALHRLPPLSWLSFETLNLKVGVKIMYRKLGTNIV